jgi:hypothetical protein
LDSWATTDFLMALPGSDADRLRVRLLIDGGAVRRFTIQYEALIGASWLPVVRYDTAHGFAHRDLLDRQGRNVEKRPLGGPGQFGKIATEAIADIKSNWRAYRERF